MPFTRPDNPIIPDEVKATISPLVEDCVNSWLDDTKGYPVTLQLARLGIRMCELLEDFYLSFPNLHSQDKPKE